MVDTHNARGSPQCLVTGRMILMIRSYEADCGIFFGMVRFTIRLAFT
jgi:hypothetical protein